MAALTKTETITSHTFKFTEVEVRDLVKAIDSATDTTAGLVDVYDVLQSAANQPQEG